jgi:DNA-binding YbaB/EbfC family protein
MSRPGRGGFRGLPPGFDPSKLLSSAQEQIGKAREDFEKGLGEKTTEGASGGGMVTVVASGALDVLRIKIDPSVVPEPKDQGGREMLEDLVAGAVNAALKKAKQIRSEAEEQFNQQQMQGQMQQMQKMLGGMGSVPGLGDISKLLGGM